MTLNEIYDKYNNRFNETQEAWDEAYKELSNTINPPTKKRQSYLTEHIQLLNAQISAYECIVKDLKEYLNETSR